MVVVREVCKGSWLQQKLRVTSKPLKKGDCLPEHWFVFCIHDDRVPLLEMYLSEKEVAGHRPLKLIDLFHCSYLCKSIDDDRSFVIGFKSESGRNVLEFAALTETLRDEWVNILIFKLQQTGHLEVNSNIYSPLPSLDVSSGSSPQSEDPPRISSPQPVLLNLSQARNNNSSPQENEQERQSHSYPESNEESENNFYETPRTSSSFTGTTILVSNGNTSFPDNTEIYEHIAFGVSLEDDTGEEELDTWTPSHQGEVVQDPVSPSYSRVSPRTDRDRTSRPPPVPPRRRSTSEAVKPPPPSSPALTSLGMYDVLNTPAFGLSSSADVGTSAFHFPLPPNYDSLPKEGTQSEASRESSPRVSASPNYTTSNSVGVAKSPRSLDTVVPPPLLPEVTYQRYADPTNTPVTVEDIQRRTRASSQRSLISTNSPRSLHHSLSTETTPDVPRTPVPAPPLPPRNNPGSPRNTGPALSGYSSPPSAATAGPPTVRRKLTLKEEEVARLQREMETQCGIKVTVPFQDALSGLALVEAGGRIWICGWTQKCHKRLSVGFHVGDQVVSVNGQTVSSLKQVDVLVKSSASQQSNVTFVVRRLPMAQVYILKRNENFDDLGIIRKEGKAEAGLERDGPSFQDASARVPWVITEVNNRPLSMKAKGEAVAGRLNAVGRDISLLVHPKDFVTHLKTQLKSKKNWKDYVVG